MSDDLFVRLGCPNDDSQIKALMARNAMPGSMSITFSTEPSFFDAVEVEGRDPKVIVGEKRGRIIGAGLATTRDVYINGQPAQIGYLSSLRIDPDARRSIGLARGFQFLKQLHNDNSGHKIYLTTIFEENTLARSILTSNRIGLPVYSEFANYHTLVIPLWPHHSSCCKNDLNIVSGSQVGPDAIVQFLNTWGKRKQFYPVYSVSDIVNPTGILRGLSIDDFHVALQNGSIAGVVASWDQLAFRQNIVVSYSKAMNIAKWCINELRHILPIPTLPNLGEPIRMVLAACLAIRNDDPHVFDILLRHLLNEIIETDNHFLMLGFASNDPLAAVAKRYIHLTLRSRVYVAAWEDGQDDIKTLNRSLVPYLELGSL